MNPVAVRTSTRDGRFGEVAVSIGSIVFRVVIPLVENERPCSVDKSLAGKTRLLCCLVYSLSFK